MSSYNRDENLNSVPDIENLNSVPDKEKDELTMNTELFAPYSLNKEVST